MDDAKKLSMLAEVMEMGEDELSPDMVLADIDMWDSMSQLSFIAMMDDEFGKLLSGDDMKKFKTVSDLLEVMKS